jgi:hypothetical protein
MSTTPADDEPWEAPDGTRWLWFPVFQEWTGWQPGEDGLWSYTDEELRRIYPGVPEATPR